MSLDILGSCLQWTVDYDSYGIYSHRHERSKVLLLYGTKNKSNSRSDRCFFIFFCFYHLFWDVEP